MYALPNVKSRIILCTDSNGLGRDLASGKGVTVVVALALRLERCGLRSPLRNNFSCLNRLLPSSPHPPAYDGIRRP